MIFLKMIFLKIRFIDVSFTYNKSLPVQSTIL